MGIWPVGWAGGLQTAAWPLASCRCFALHPMLPHLHDTRAKGVAQPLHDQLHCQGIHSSTWPEPLPQQEIRVKGVPDALRNQLQRRGVGKLAVDLVAPKQAGLERVFQMLLG